MSKSIIIAVVVIGIIVVAIGLSLLMRRRRTERLHSVFGPEYDRAARTAGDKAKAEAELEEREKRVEKLDIRPLDASSRDRFASRWMQIQSDFVDDPRRAIGDADRLIGEVMSKRGYPVENFNQVAADISVDHPSVVQRYRTGHDIVVRHAEGDGDTEDLRAAMINYRPLFDELVSTGGDDNDDLHKWSKKDDRRTRARV